MDQHYSASAYGERCTLVRTSPLLCFSKGKIYIFAVLDNVEADLHRIGDSRPLTCAVVRLEVILQNYVMTHSISDAT